MSSAATLKRVREMAPSVGPEFLLDPDEELIFLEVPELTDTNYKISSVELRLSPHESFGQIPELQCGSEHHAESPQSSGGSCFLEPGVHEVILDGSLYLQAVERPMVGTPMGFSSSGGSEARYLGKVDRVLTALSTRYDHGKDGSAMEDVF